jgi:hypothetical protein
MADVVRQTKDEIFIAARLESQPNHFIKWGHISIYINHYKKKEIPVKINNLHPPAKQAPFATHTPLWIGVMASC